MNNSLYKELTEEELQRIEAEFIPEAKRCIPEIVEACIKAKKEGLWGIMLHQDAFAQRLEPAEIQLLGMAIKYAGIVGVSIGFSGRNGDTTIKSRREKSRSTLKFNKLKKLSKKR